MTPVLLIHWNGVPTRTEAPSLAQSARIRLTALGSTTPLEQLLVRPGPTATVLQSYPLNGTVHPGQAQLIVDFYATLDGTGAAIASGAGTVEILPDSGLVTSITISDNIAYLALPTELTLTIGASVTVRPSAQLLDGTFVAIPTETLTWRFLAEQSRFSRNGSIVTALQGGQEVLTVEAMSSTGLSLTAATSLIAYSPLPVGAATHSQDYVIWNTTSDGTLLSFRDGTAPKLEFHDGQTGALPRSLALREPLGASTLNPEKTLVWYYGKTTGTLYRLELASGHTDTFPGLPLYNGKTLTASLITALPGSSTRLIVVARVPDEAYVPLALDAGVQVGEPLPFTAGQALGISADRFYFFSGQKVARYQLTGSGHTKLDETTLETGTSSLISQSVGQLYLGDSAILDAETYASRGSFPFPLFPNTAPQLSPTGTRAAFVVYYGPHLKSLLVFDCVTRRLLQEFWFTLPKETMRPAPVWLDESSLLVTDHTTALVLPNLVV